MAERQEVASIKAESERLRKKAESNVQNAKLEVDELTKKANTNVLVFLMILNLLEYKKYSFILIL